MKKLLILFVILFISCAEVNNNKKKPIPFLYERGNVVYVTDIPYVVTYAWSDNTYDLKQLNCKGDDCIIRVKQSQIKKRKKF